MNKQSVFVLNRLEYISKQCYDNPVTFSYISTDINPADCLSRAISYKLLSNSNYISGPEIINDANFSSIMDVIVPNPLAVNNVMSMSADIDDNSCSNNDVQLFEPSRYGSFKKLVNVAKIVLKFVALLKHKIGKNSSVNMTECDYEKSAVCLIIKQEQKYHFPDEYNFLSNPTNLTKDIPSLVTKLNLYIDESGLIKVKCKFKRFSHSFNFPVLLPKNSIVTNLIIRDQHVKMSHAGCYSLLTSLRRKFWIPSIYSTVKKVLKSCVIMWEV